MTIIYGTSGNDTLVGGSDHDELYGYEGDDTLTGNAGNDLLDGGTGADTMTGGSGSDTYMVDDAGDVVVETSGVGIDTVVITISSYTLTANVENLDMRYATGPVTVNGNSLGNVFYMTDQADVSVDGKSGNDTANYSGSSGYVLVDLYTGLHDGEALTDTLVSIENVTGTDYGDDLRGTNSANVLDGGAGADTLTGRLGNDIYYVDDEYDVVVENASEGTDEIRTTVDRVLDDNVEKMRYVGTGDFIGTGNDLNNEIYGGGGSDLLTGGDGNDYLGGGAGTDFLYGGAGVDTLSGGSGADDMDGGADGDVYMVDNEFDNVFESFGGGEDIVYVSSVVGMLSMSYTLSSEVEDMSYNGSVAFTGTGNELQNQMYGSWTADTLYGMDDDDELRGNGGNDFLYGGNGNDLIVGNGGADTLDGGAGDDTFRIGGYDSGMGSSADTISDFEQGTDKIDLNGWDPDIYTPGDQAFTFIGTSAFSSTAGELRYSVSGGNTIIEGDMDGLNGADFQIVLVGSFALTATDFVL